MREDHLYKRERGFQSLCRRIWPEDYPASPRLKFPIKLSPSNKALLKRFKLTLEGQNYGLNRKHRLIESMGLMAQLFGKDLETATKEDIQGEGGLQSKIVERWGKNDTTIGMYLQILKQFYRWLYHIHPKSPETPEPIKGMYFMKKKGKKIFELPTEQQVAKLIATPNHIMYRALFSTIYNTAGRIGEIATLKVKDVVFNNQEAIVNITNSKTDARPVLLLDSAVSLLREWLAVHPYRDEIDFQNQYLFVSVSTNAYGKPMTYPAITKTLKQSAKKMGLNNVSLHKLRHWKATHLILRGMNETKLKAILGHSFNSKATAVYLHVASKDTFETIREIYHKERVKPAEDPQQAKTCPSCGYSNDFTQTACIRCNRPIGLNEGIPSKEKEIMATQEISALKEKIELIERSMNILVEAIRLNPPKALTNPRLARIIVERARKTQSQALEVIQR